MRHDSRVRPVAERPGQRPEPLAERIAPRVTAEPRRSAKRPASRPPALLQFLADAGFPAASLTRAWAGARRAGCCVEEALYAETTITERDVVRALGERLGFATTVTERVGDALVRPYEVAARTGILRLQDGRIAVEARGAGLALILSGAFGPARHGIVLATRRDLRDLALAADRRRAAWCASYGLDRARPYFSALLRQPTGKRIAAWFATSFAVGFVLGANLLGATSALVRVGCLFFLAVAGLRLATLLTPQEASPPRSRRREDMLPVVTVLVPLSHEDAALRGLVAALQELDYPRAKLDIKLLVEEEDRHTFAALAALALPATFDLVSLPAGEPQTKPRALNIGLALARGELTIVYDAEDRPAPGQLRDIVERFAGAPTDTAVVQAQLVIDPLQAGGIADLFRLDYAGLFAVVLPALSAMRLPVPLGGTSNCFRTEVLRAAGGWDAFNVTEDAEIGLRLFRLGYRVVTVPSRTEEEAPHTAAAWLKQRRRWLKGWMLTLIVHGRRPRDILRDCGPTGTFAFVALTGGIVSAALLEPLVILLVGWQTWQGTFLRDAATLTEAFELAGFLACLVIGHGVAVLTGVAGLRRLGEPLRARSLLALPLYWLGLSVAAWVALRDLFVDPHRWDKTEHRLARMPDPKERR